MKFRQFVADTLVKDKEKLSTRLSTLKESMWSGGTAPHIYTLGIGCEWSALLYYRCTPWVMAADNQLLG